MLRLKNRPHTEADQDRFGSGIEAAGTNLTVATVATNPDLLTLSDFLAAISDAKIHRRFSTARAHSAWFLQILGQGQKTGSAIRLPKSVRRPEASRMLCMATNMWSC